MQRTTLLILALLLSIGCSSPNAEERVVLTAADSTFARLLADLHEADAVALSGMESGAFAPDHARRDSVLSAHGWTESTFSTQADAYSAEPARLLTIYDLAVDVAAGR